MLPADFREPLRTGASARRTVSLHRGVVVRQPAMRTTDSPLRAAVRPALKRLIDVVGAGGLLLFLAVPLCLIALLVRIDGGPAPLELATIRGRNDVVKILRDHGAK